MIPIIFLAILLVTLTFLFHYQMLLWLSTYTARLQLPDQNRVLLIVLALFLTHVAEIGFYAIAYKGAIDSFQLGSLQGIEIKDLMDYLYFSSVIYTSLGIGDVYPDGHIRFLTGIEALNGLLLIAWSASFTFLAMGRLWPWDECCETEENNESKEK